MDDKVMVFMVPNVFQKKFLKPGGTAKREGESVGEFEVICD
jgi:hypothetical protein